ncbi:MAG: hypothetical protein BroJett007_33860 [Chloroflexota bacterium]|nr:MAG: hypothetical protein BroJett007_33860 [Chloroflexota bacterium]
MCSSPSGKLARIANTAAYLLENWRVTGRTWRRIRPYSGPDGMQVAGSRVWSGVPLRRLHLPADIPEVRGPKAPGASPTTFDGAHLHAEAVISGVSGL